MFVNSFFALPHRCTLFQEFPGQTPRSLPPLPKILFPLFPHPTPSPQSTIPALFPLHLYPPPPSPFLRDSPPFPTFAFPFNSHPPPPHHPTLFVLTPVAGTLRPPPNRVVSLCSFFAYVQVCFSPHCPSQTFFFFSFSNQHEPPPNPGRLFSQR